MSSIRSTLAESADDHLATVAPVLAGHLKRSIALTPPRHAVADIRCKTVLVAMRDGVRLATDLYFPPVSPAPVIAVRTPTGRAVDAYVGTYLFLARRGYVVAAQDCRGTGGSEPDRWDYYVREPEDGWDFVDWISHQDWFGGFLGSLGSSYMGQTQWQMAMHPAMTTIVPEVSGLGEAINTAHLHMFCNAYALAIGKGEEKVQGVSLLDLEEHIEDRTWATGFFNEPLYKPVAGALLDAYPQLSGLDAPGAQRWLWDHYCALGCAERADFIKRASGASDITIVEMEAMSDVFGHQISHDRHTLPHPRPSEQCRTFHTPVLLRTGWYDWGLNDTLATWALLVQEAPEPMRSRCRLLIAPSSHNMPGYHEGMDKHPELQHAHGPNQNFEVLLHWYESLRADDLGAWPAVVYYLMGANEWRASNAWPPPRAEPFSMYLGAGGQLSRDLSRPSEPDVYVYDPHDPTPTVGGSILSFYYTPGSVDVSEVQSRRDVLTYTTTPLEQDLDVVGPVTCILFASSSAVDTDFVVRLSDVSPDGRAIQLQNGLLRARYRNLRGEPELLEPGEIYRLEIDMWATANRFKVGHRLRIDISSADFPRLDRNANLGGTPGNPIPATQTIYHDPEHPSQVILSVLGDAAALERR